MTEQVIIKMDSKLKKAVQKRAKAEGTTLSSVLRSVAMSYSLGQFKIGLVDLSWAPVETEELNKRTKRRLARIDKDVREGKNLSPVFTDIESMRKYLKI